MADEFETYCLQWASGENTRFLGYSFFLSPENAIRFYQYFLETNPKSHDHLHIFGAGAVPRHTERGLVLTKVTFPRKGMLGRRFAKMLKIDKNAIDGHGLQIKMPDKLCLDPDFRYWLNQIVSQGERLIVALDDAPQRQAPSTPGNMLKSFRLAWLNIENPFFEAYSFFPSHEAARDIVDLYHCGLLIGEDFSLKQFGIKAKPHLIPDNIVLDHVAIPCDLYMAQGIGAAPNARKLVRKGDFVYASAKDGPDILREARTLHILERFHLPYKPPHLIPPKFTAPVIPFRPKEQKPEAALKTAQT